MKKDEDHKITVRLSEDLHRPARIRIAELNSSFQEVVVTLLEQWVTGKIRYSSDEQTQVTPDVNDRKLPHPDIESLIVNFITDSKSRLVEFESRSGALLHGAQPSTGIEPAERQEDKDPRLERIKDIAREVLGSEAVDGPNTTGVRTEKPASDKAPHRRKKAG